MPFEALKERLLRAGIAPRRVKRYLGELNDHLTELTARELAAGYDSAEAAVRARALLGSDDDLAQAWVADPRFKSFTARAPWLVFSLLPPFVLILVMMIPAVGLVLLMISNGLLDLHPPLTPDWIRQVATGVTVASNLLAAPLVAAMLVAIARRQRLALGWPLIGIAILLVLFLHLGVNLPLSPAHKGPSISLRWTYNRNSLALGLTPVFFRQAWDLMAAQWPLVTAQYLLTLLPLAWLYSVQRPRPIMREALCES